MPACESLKLHQRVRELEAENARLREAYNHRTEEVIQLRAERDDLLAERGIVHHGSDAT